MIIDAHNHADWHGHNLEKFIANMDRVLLVRIILEGIALIGASALFIYFSTKMKNRISRIYYLFLCLGFTLALFVVYLLYLIG